MLHQEILGMAKTILETDSADTMLEAMCRSAEDYLTKKLRPGILPTDCAETFILAAASLAARAWEDGLGGGPVESFSAGSVSVTMGSGERASTALRMLAPWLQDDGFSFRSVRA